MHWNKKGALELSITAIVVLIIAITVLGLAIYFIKNLFGESTKLLTNQLEQIKDQLRKNMEETGDLIVFSGGSELKAKRGSKVDFYVGVRNQGQASKCYRISMVCVKPFLTEGTCTESEKEDAVVGGYYVGNTNWFPKLLQEFEVSPGDIRVLPVTMQIVGNPDTYLSAMNVYEASGGCASPGTWSDKPWQSKSFTVELT